jgi:hypothetical protein
VDAPYLHFKDWFAANALRIAEDATEEDWAWEGWNAAVKAAAYVVGIDGNLMPENETDLAIERVRRDLEDLLREQLIAE